MREAAGELNIAMPLDVAAAVTRLGIATVTPAIAGEWRVTGVSKVGVIRLGDHEVRIEPKVPLDRLFHVLARSQEWGSWFDESVRLGSVDDLYPAIAEAMATWGERVLRTGVLRGYRITRAAEPTVRGRWLVDEQIRKRRGLPLPAELQFDEFTADIPENRMLRSAARRLVGFAGLPDAVRARLLRIDLQLGEVTLLVRGQSLPDVGFDRRNERYRPVVTLAELILTNGSLDHRVGGVAATGFLLDLPRVFERFVEAEVTRASRSFGGEVRAQWSTALDRDGHVQIRPDLVWRHEGRVRAVFDAKYKAEKPAGYPNADIYQMLAYCIRHELRTGHLIYAAGNEVPARYVVSQAGVEIVCHAIALDRSDADIARQIDGIVAQAMS